MTCCLTNLTRECCIFARLAFQETHANYIYVHTECWPKIPWEERRPANAENRQFLRSFLPTLISTVKLAGVLLLIITRFASSSSSFFLLSFLHVVYSGFLCTTTTFSGLKPRKEGKKERKERNGGSEGRRAVICSRDRSKRRTDGRTDGQSE